MTTPQRVIHSFGDVILTSARRLGMEADIAQLSDAQAVRLIQNREGNTDCFAADRPLRPTATGACAESQCCWIGVCEAYRSGAPPVDKALPEVDAKDMSWFKNYLISQSDDSLDVGGSTPLGMNIKSLSHLKSLSSKLVIGSPRTLICEAPDNVAQLNVHLLKHEMIHNWPTGGGLNPTYFLDRTYLFTTGLRQLFDWAHSARDFLSDNTLEYRPHLTVSSAPVEVWRLDPHVGQPYRHFPRTEDMRFQTFHAPHIGLPDGQVSFTDPDIVPIVNLELPVLENVDLKVLHDIFQENPDALQSFRSFLGKKADEMRSKSIGSETFAKDVKRIGRELDDGVRKIDNAFKKHRMRSLIAASGAAVMTWSLALYCIITGDAEVLKFIGPSGVLYVIGKEYTEYYTSALGLKDDPVYLLWVIGKSGTKKA